jgi:hypothetical protein
VTTSPLAQGLFQVRCHLSSRIQSLSLDSPQLGFRVGYEKAADETLVSTRRPSRARRQERELTVMLAPSTETISKLTSVANMMAGTLESIEG